ncbi:hypothetical protein OK016_08595 [Vibrio chagasii]|nr:hypothetical protein [Vibrio chagasii]
MATIAFGIQTPKLAKKQVCTADEQRTTEQKGMWSLHIGTTTRREGLISHWNKLSQENSKAHTIIFVLVRKQPIARSRQKLHSYRKKRTLLKQVRTSLIRYSRAESADHHPVRFSVKARARYQIKDNNNAEAHSALAQFT